MFSIASDENDGNLDAGLDQSALDIQSIPGSRTSKTRQLGPSRESALQILLRRSK
jgi:hypothetical protein